MNEKCSFAENILMIVRSLYLRKTYSDVTIKMKDVSFPAHKFVLQARYVYIIRILVREKAENDNMHLKWRFTYFNLNILHTHNILIRSDKWNETVLEDIAELDWTDDVDDTETVQSLLKWLYIIKFLILVDLFFNDLFCSLRLYTDVIDNQQQDQCLIKLLRAAFNFRLNNLIGMPEKSASF